MALRHSFATRAFLAISIVTAPWLGCGSSGQCRPETWSGTCRLQTVTKVREMELPLPSVVFEAIYRPESSGGPLLPDVRREFVALSRYEQALHEYVLSHSVAPCYINPPPPGQCNPGAMIVDVPEFDATRASITPEEDTGPKGCAQLDATSTQDRIREQQTDAEAITERFHFADGSAELPADATTIAETVAARLRQDPSIQCVGVVGQFVRGENLEIAFARARAVRELLIQRGVEPERLVALTLDRPLTGGTGTIEPSSPADRRVSLSVLLKLSPKR